VGINYPPRYENAQWAAHIVAGGPLMLPSVCLIVCRAATETGVEFSPNRCAARRTRTLTHVRAMSALPPKSGHSRLGLALRWCFRACLIANICV